MIKSEKETNFRRLMMLSFGLLCFLVLASIGVLAGEDVDNELPSHGDYVWYHIVYQAEMFGKNKVSSQQASTKRCASIL